MRYATLMVQIRIGQPNDAVLEVTRLLADTHKAAILAVAGAQKAQQPHAEDYAFLGDVAAQSVAANRAKIAAAEAEFRAALESREIEWRLGDGYHTVTEYFAAEARGADLVIVNADPPARSLAPAERFELADLVMLAGRPVLAVPSATGKPASFARAMVCWKDTLETRRAVAGALPLLRHASHVSLVQAVSEGKPVARERMELVCQWFERNGVTVEPMILDADGNDAARLRDEAAVQNPDIVVAGIYSHTRLRERIFGGVSLDMLKHLNRCVLLAH